MASYMNAPLPGISFLVLNYNGRAEILKCLAALYAAIRAYPGQSEVLLVDNGSTDDSVEFAVSHFPKLKVIKTGDRFLVARAFNLAVPRTRFDYFFPLATDMRLNKGCILPLVWHLRDRTIFCVTPLVMNPWKHTVDYGRNFAVFSGGLLRVVRPFVNLKPPLSERASYSYAPAILGIFDKQKFLEIGGVDKLYRPSYWDDHDLGHCAWKRGWRVVFEPASIVWHFHRRSLAQSLGRAGALANYRNRHLFIWKNLQRKFLLQYVLFLPLNLLAGTIRYGTDYLLGFLHALARVPEVVASRAREERARVWSDERIFTESSRSGR